MSVRARGNAVWVASYPKSGNTWMLLALQAVFRGGWIDDLDDPVDRGTISASAKNFEGVIGVEPSDLTLEEILRWRPTVLATLAPGILRPTVFKLHDSARMPDGQWLVPAEGTRAVIHLVRDPRDVAVSWAHHSSTSIDTSIAYLGNPRSLVSYDRESGYAQLPQVLGTWSDHCSSWFDLGERVPVLTLRYEDRLADPAGTLAETLRFAGVDAEPEVLARAVEATGFQRLRSLEANGFSMRPLKMENFFRRGVSGGWRDEMTPAQAARVERDHGAMMERLGYL